jgi:hypothetical protein
MGLTSIDVRPLTNRSVWPCHAHLSSFSLTETKVVSAELTTRMPATDGDFTGHYILPDPYLDHRSDRARVVSG